MHSTSTIARPATTPSTASTGGNEPRQCWECLRRRWVCDAARPVCNKCRAAGIVCPGYNDQKPLTWLAPGRVTSRTRRQQNSRPSKTAGTKKAAVGNGGDAKPGPQRKAEQKPVMENEEAADDSSRALVPAGSANGTETVALEASPKVTGGLRLRTDTSDVVEAVQYYNSHIYPTLLSSQLAPNPFVVPVVAIHSFPTSMRHALVSMALSHRMLQLSKSQEHRRSKSLGSTSPDSNGSASSSFRGFALAGSSDEDLSIPSLEVAKPGSLAVTSGSSSPSDMSWRLHYHIGLAIRALNEEIDKEATRSSDATILSVLVFLMAELQQSISPHWRPHVDGLTALIMLRGGLGELIESAAHLRPALLSFTIVAVIANTTSPPSDQITATTHFQLIDTVSRLYSIGVFPSLPCPQSLFLDIIRVNYLRFRATTNLGSLPGDQSELSVSAVLNRIDTFDPEAWLQSSSASHHAKEGLLIARIFQSAVALFALSTLPWPLDLKTSMSSSSTSIFPESDLPIMMQTHRGRLFALLDNAMESPVLKKSVAWPLVVAGVVAAAGTQGERSFVEHHLSEMSRDTGNASPLVAIGMLKQFWAAGRTEWDSCFHQPCAIFT